MQFKFEMKRINIASRFNNSAGHLLDLNPNKSGYLEKENSSILAKILPCLFDKYKRRLFILIGNFIFRYEDEGSLEPKGTPIPLDCVSKIEGNDCMIILKGIRKSYILKASSPSIANEWKKAIKTRKSNAIRENMGHAQISEGVKNVNKFGNRLNEKKSRRENILAKGNDYVNNPLLGELR